MFVHFTNLPREQQIRDLPAKGEGGSGRLELFFRGTEGMFLDKVQREQQGFPGLESKPNDFFCRFRVPQKAYRKMGLNRSHVGTITGYTKKSPRNGK